MNVTRYNQTIPAKNIFDTFDDFFSRNIADFLGSDDTINTPSVNIVETEKAYRLEVAAPGLTKEDFEVNVDQGLLRVSAQREQKDEVKDGKYTRRAFNYTALSRSFKLPEIVDADAIAATYENGVLNITLPKKNEAVVETARKIEIK